MEHISFTLQIGDEVLWSHLIMQEIGAAATPLTYSYLTQPISSTIVNGEGGTFYDGEVVKPQDLLLIRKFERQ